MSELDDEQMTLDQLPPHDPGAERGVLGCILLAPSECIDQCLDALPTPEVFYELRHRQLYEAMLALQDAGTTPDLITLSTYLGDTGTMEAVGGLSYVAGLQDAVPSAANLGFYLDTVRDKYARRRILQAASAASAAAKSDTPIEAVIAGFEADAVSILDRRAETTLSGASLSSLFIADAEECHRRAGGLTGLPYGLPDLDRMTGGMQPGELVVIGARPSIGKTALGGTIALHNAVLGPNPAPTLFVSLEMSAKAILRRLGCGISGVPLSCFRTGQFQERQFGPMTVAAKRLKDSPLWVDYPPNGLTAARLRALIRRHVRKNGVKLVVVDYLQKLKPDARHEKRTYEVGAVVEAVKAEAVRSNIAIVALAQLGRAAEGDDVVPSMRDLSDSKQIEAEADVILLLHRKRSEHTGPASIFIEKQRDGECGIVSAHYVGPICRFYPAQKEEAPHPSAESLDDHP